MNRVLKIGLLSGLALCGLFALHIQYNMGGWSAFIKKMSGGAEQRGVLTVGFLPVTCHLTCPVTDWVTSHSESGSVFQSKKYTNFEAVVEDFKSKQLQASFILAPLAMTLRRQGTPIKIVYLGHRDGTTIIVHKDSPYKTFRDLKGKKIAVPHMYSNQRILLARQLEKEGMSETDITMVPVPPPEHPSMLQKGAIDAYIIGEPHAAKAEIAGFGRVLYFTKDIWPNFISCVLAVSEDLIKTNRPLVQELVNGIAASGKWIDSPGEELLAGIHKESEGVKADNNNVVLPRDWDTKHRSQAAAIASQQKYYAQPPDLVRFVLSKPIDRVRYVDLLPARKDFEEIQRYAEKLGFFKPSTPQDPFGFDDYCDTSFATSPTAKK
jgi:NitT/TauT family transport system substrate-binding protein